MNGFSKSEMIFFEDVIAGFSANNVTSRNVRKYEPNMTSMERSGLTVRRPIPMIAQTTEGRDTTGQKKDVLELTVPSTLAESDIINHVFGLTAVELNDKSRRDRAAKAALQSLAAKVDVRTSDEIIKRGGLVATETGDFSSYDSLSKGETLLNEREVPTEAMRSLILNPRMSRKMANELAGRQTDNSRDRSAYERSRLPDVAGFETLKANVLTAVEGSSSSGVTVSGANQRKTPTVFDKNNDTAADNRQMTLTVSASNGLKAGDAFTIAGVEAVGMITKKATGQLQTFRVLSISGNDAVISPAIIPLDGGSNAFEKYANVNATPANGAAITVLNTDTTQPSIFFCEDAVELIHGKLEMDDAASNISVAREVTDSGIEIVFLKQSDIDTLETTYRLSCWCAANVLDPLMAGIYLPNQAASFG